MNFEKEYKQQLGAVCFSENFEAETVELLKTAAQGKERKLMKKSVRIILAAAIFVLLMTVTVFAISGMLSARDVAEKIGENRVAESFDRQEYTPKTVTDKGYTVSFLGVVKGERFLSDDIKADCSYFAVAVASADGSALSLVDGNPLGMSVIIEGYPAWKINSWSLNTSAHGTEENGILYYLYNCENLEIFADRNVYLAVYEGYIPSLDIITMKDSGEFEFAESYEGFKALFRLPLDTAKANPEAAAEILKEFFAEEETVQRVTENDGYTNEAVGETVTHANGKVNYTIDCIGRKSAAEMGIAGSDGNEFYVYAVRNADGTPLSADNVPLEIQPVVKSCPVWAVNGYRLNVQADITEKNGTIYYLFNCDDLDYLADRTVYLAAVESGAPYLEIIELENDGTFSFSADYEGWGTVLQMNLDKEKADREKADKVISELLPKSNEKWHR